MKTQNKVNIYIQDAIVCESIVNATGEKPENRGNILILNGEVNSYAKKWKDKEDRSILNGLYWSFMNIKIHFNQGRK